MCFRFGAILPAQDADDCKICFACYVALPSTVITAPERLMLSAVILTVEGAILGGSAGKVWN